MKTLEPEVMMGLLHKFDMKIYKFVSGELPAIKDHNLVAYWGVRLQRFVPDRTLEYAELQYV